jgi:hypothetical protein
MSLCPKFSYNLFFHILSQFMSSRKPLSWCAKSKLREEKRLMELQRWYIHNILKSNTSTSRAKYYFSWRWEFKTFSYAHYSRNMRNGKVRDRKWLVYLRSVDKVLCFSGKLFNPINRKNTLGRDGFRDWYQVFIGTILCIHISKQNTEGPKI